MTAVYRTAPEPPATILIVDDGPENLAVLGELLQPSYRVRVANSGERALAVAASPPTPDLILLDVMMPGMDGYAVLARLRENPATRDTPVIFITALDAVEDEQRGLDLGAVDYIAKPLQPGIVAARVRTQLELKRARDLLQDQNAALEAEVARRVVENLRLRDEADRAQARLNHQREVILATAAEGICEVDANGVFTFVNPAFAAMLDYTRDELIGRDAHDSIHHLRPDGSPYPREECHLTAALQAGVAIQGLEETFWCKNGTPLTAEFSSMPIVENERRLGAVVTLMDVGERKRYREQLERKSNFDDLTGLPNRNLLTDRLAHAVERSARDGSALALLTVNLDRFKAINDSLGRDVGDLVLREVSRRLTGIARKADTLARAERDEFVLVAEVSSVDAMTKVADTMRAALAEPFLLEARELFLSASIGIALFPKDGDNGETLLRNAAAAMLEAKACGGDGFRYYAAEMNARSLERLELENALRRALEKGEFILHYQPQINLRNGQVIGAEALVRWQSAERGLVPPEEFIQLAEETGLIVPIGEWVLGTACAQNKAWQQAGLPPVSIAVNCSARQFAAQDVVAMAGAVLRETGLDPGYLELELTESAVMADAEAFIQATEKLKGLAVTLTIDDFGTGFSSLSYLKRFAVDRLKIDRSFVHDVTHDPDSAAIAMAVIALAHSLKLSAVAEGVETEAQLNFLRLRGCDEMQGFVFSGPLPPAEFERLLRTGRTLAFPPGTDLPQRTLLLVDDEPETLSALRLLLRREGYTLLTAAGGREALEIMAGFEVGVIVSNARMRGMSGAELLGKAKKIYPDCVRILLSGYTDLNAVTEAVNEGEPFRFIAKPWEDAVLLETIRDAFRRHETRRWPHAAAAEP